MSSCPFCGASLPPNSRFCNQCGNSLAPPAGQPLPAAGQQQAAAPAAPQYAPPPQGQAAPPAGYGGVPLAAAAVQGQPAQAPVQPVARQAAPVYQTQAMPAQPVQVAQPAAPQSAPAPVQQAQEAQPPAAAPVQSAQPTQPGAQPPAQPPEAGQKPPAPAKKGKPKKRRKKLIRGIISFVVLIALLVLAFMALDYFYPGTIQSLVGIFAPQNKASNKADDGLFAGLADALGGGDDHTAAINDIRSSEALASAYYYDEDPARGMALARSDGTTMGFPGPTTRRGLSLDLELGVSWARSTDPAAGGPQLGQLSIVSGSGRVEAAIPAVREQYYFNTHLKVLYYVTEEGELCRWQAGETATLATGASGVAASANDAWVVYRSGVAIFTLAVEGAPAEDTSGTAAAPEATKFSEATTTTIPLGISADGNTIYYADPSAGAADTVTIFCLQRGTEGGDSIQVRPLASGYANLALNYAGTEAVAYGENGVWRCRGGRFEMVGIGDAAVSLGSRNFSPNYDSTAGIYAATRARESFDTFAYTVDGELYLQHGDDAAQLVNYGVTSFEIGEDASRLTYLRQNSDGDGELYLCELEEGKVAGERVVATGVAAFDNARSGNQLYYLTANADGDTGTLYYYAAAGRPDEAIDDSVWLGGENGSISRYFIASADGGRCCFITGYDSAARSGALYTTGAEGSGLSLVGAGGAILAVGPGAVLYADEMGANPYNSAYLICRLMLYTDAGTREVRPAAALGA